MRRRPGGKEFERELRGILSGDEAWIRKTTKTASPDEAAGYRLTLRRPFLVVRAGGSLGVDLVALRGDVSFPIEVKSSREDVLRFSDASGANQEQARELAGVCARSGVIPLYAYRRKSAGGDAWRLFALPCEGLTGRSKLLHDRIPKAEVGPSGAYILRFADGFPLSRFLAWLDHIGAPVASPEPA